MTTTSLIKSGIASSNYVRYNSVSAGKPYVQTLGGFGMKITNPNQWSDLQVAIGTSGAIYVGSYFGDGTNNYMSATKVNADGSVAWSKKYQLPTNFSYFWYFHNVEVNETVGSFLMTGRMVRSGVTPTYTGYFFKVATADGAIQKEQGYALSTSVNNFSTGCAIATDGSVYVSGYSTMSNQPNHVMKRTSSGSLSWIMHFIPNQYGDGAVCALGESDSVYIVHAAQMNSSYDASFAKITSGGSASWNRVMTGVPINSYQMAIISDLSSNMYSCFRNGSTLYVCKITSDGSLSWTRTLTGSNLNGLQSIKVDSSGNIYSMFVDNGAVCIIKFDSSGNAIWQRKMLVAGSKAKLNVIGDYFYISSYSGSNVNVYKLPIDGSGVGNTYLADEPFKYMASSYTINTTTPSWGSLSNFSSTSVTDVTVTTTATTTVATTTSKKDI